VCLRQKKTNIHAFVKTDLSKSHLIKLKAYMVVNFRVCGIN
jgi:hypothetical protein